MRHTVTISCDEASTTWPSLAQRALNRARRRTRNPLLLPGDLTWTLSWEESFVPLDIDSSAEERAARRELVVADVVLACRHGSVSIDVAVPGVPALVLDVLVRQEQERWPPMGEVHGGR